MSNSALDRVMGQAEEAAQNFQAPALQQTGTALTQPGGPGALAKPDLKNFADAGGMTVDMYVRPAEAGLQIGDETKKYVDDFVAELDMNEVIPIYSCRGESGGNTKFIKSYDGVSTPNGENFQQAVSHMNATTKSSGVYQTAEIPMTLVDDVTFPDKVVVPAETRVGLTPSLTGFKEFQSFVRLLTKQGLNDAVVKVRCKHLLRVNRNNNKWGVVVFELIEKIRD